MLRVYYTVFWPRLQDRLAATIAPSRHSPTPADPAASPSQPSIGLAGIISKLYVMLSTLISVARRSLEIRLVHPLHTVQEPHSQCPLHQHRPDGTGPRRGRPGQQCPCANGQRTG